MLEYHGSVFRNADMNHKLSMFATIAMMIESLVTETEKTMSKDPGHTTYNVSADLSRCDKLTLR